MLQKVQTNQLNPYQAGGVINKILQILMSVSNFATHTDDPAGMSSVHHFKLASAISRCEKIQFVLPAFPAKSKNHEKTYSHRPDLGEVESLKRLNEIALKISEIYYPGAEFIICSDGRVFSDLVGVTEVDVTEYRLGINDIAKKFSLTKLSFFDLEDIFPSKFSFSQMRYSLEKEYAVSINEIKANVKSNDSKCSLFNGIHRFIKEDYLVIKKEITKNQINKQAKEVAYKVMQRSNAWSTLVAQKFPDAFRLSIHPQDLTSEKFPIKLLPCNERWGTPWHRVPVMQNGELSLMRNLDIKKMGGVLKKYQGLYAYFELGVRQ
ncbi:MAG: L-tyrosine/L-tryptophan isonitrile synthase family protein [Halobacteriovoraceae bacterium]|jgi:pyoverdine/dityrosine biosynthesis protein Dit1|nr:L-tyrosine/L-tryptophan isonitrile synthase family protein [Halobacteriovoraceae bacterium]